MRMEDPVPTFSYLVTKLKENHPNLAYIHAVEPRVYGSIDLDSKDIANGDTNDIFRKIWGDRPFIVAGGFRTPEDIAETVRIGLFDSFLALESSCLRLRVAIDSALPILIVRWP